MWITSTYHLQLPTKVNTTSVADHSSSNNNYKKQCTSHKHCSNAGDWVSSCDTIQTVNGSVVYSKVCNIVSLWSMTNLSSLGCHPIFPQCDWIHNWSETNCTRKWFWAECSAHFQTPLPRSHVFTSGACAQERLWWDEYDYAPQFSLWGIHKQFH